MHNPGRSIPALGRTLLSPAAVAVDQAAYAGGHPALEL